MSLNAYSDAPERATATSAPFTSNAFAAPSSTSAVVATVMNPAIVSLLVVVSRSLRGSGRGRSRLGVGVGCVGARSNGAPPRADAPHVGPRQGPVEHGERDHALAERDREQYRHERSCDPRPLEEHLVPNEHAAEGSLGRVSLHQTRERETRELRG